MLTIKNLKAGYNGSEILHGVDLEIRPGEVVALIGPNGAGKTTILKSIFNIAQILAGEIKFKDRLLNDRLTYELINLGISYVPQGRLVFAQMTVKENLEMGAYALKDKTEVAKNLEDVYHKFPILKEKSNQRASSLSGGQQQLLAIARALIQNPDVLLLDEPSLGLSPKVVKEVFDKIVEISKEGVAILMVEQNAKQAVGIADRTYVLEGGEIALTGGKEILNDRKIREIYFGEG
jgi:branched-chain amino acid transport system ATP-binding protein